MAILKGPGRTTATKERADATSSARVEAAAPSGGRMPAAGGAHAAGMCTYGTSGDAGEREEARSGAGGLNVGDVGGIDVRDVWKVALCMDETMCMNPEMIGLEGESFDTQGWLDVFTQGDEARAAIGVAGAFSQAWVASCDDVDAINLAATLKADNPQLPVALVTPATDGSLLSRARNAFIDEVLDQTAFTRRYAQAKANARVAAPDVGGRVGGLLAARSAGTEGAGATGADAAAAQSEPEISLALAKPEPMPEPLAPTVLERPQVAVAVRGRGCLVPVVSGSGGAGKSSVAVLAAHIARDRGLRTLLLDYDLQFGDMALMCGIERPVAIDEAMARPDSLERAMAGDSGLAVLAAPDRLEKADTVVADMPDFLDGLCERFEVIVANTGGAWAEQHAVLLERSFAALFLIDQRASSIRACKHALELCARCGIATSPFEFALNRCAKGAPLTAADVSSALQGAPVLELKDGGRDVEDCLGAGSPVELLQGGNDLVASLRQALDHVLPDSGGIAGAGAGAGAGRGASSKPDKAGLRRRGRHAGRKRGRKAR